MKYKATVFLFIFLTISLLGEEKKEPFKSFPLKQLKSFEVITVFSPYEQVDQRMVYDMMINAFKKVGKVTVMKEESMVSSLLLLNQTDPNPIWFFSIGRKQNHLELSLEIGALVEVVANSSKMICPIWKRKTFIDMQGEGAHTKAICSAMEEIIKEFAEEYNQTNPKHQLDPSFYVREFDRF